MRAAYRFIISRASMDAQVLNNKAVVLAAMATNDESAPLQSARGMLETVVRDVQASAATGMEASAAEVHAAATEADARRAEVAAVAQRNLARLGVRL